MNGNDAVVGQRIRIKDSLLPRSKARTGVIVMIMWSRTTRRGTRTVLFRIRRDGLKTVETWNPTFVDPV